jgi:hypothetical protein
MEILDTTDIWTLEKCRNPNKNTQNGCTGSIGR